MADQEKEIVIKISAKNLTQKEFNEARRAVSGFTNDVEKSSSSLKGLTGGLGSVAKLAAGAFTVGAVVNFVGSVFDAAEQISDLSARMGVGVEEAQRFAYAARQTGGDIEDVSKAIVKMSQVLADGDKGTIALLRSVGLELTDLRNKKPEEAFRLIVDAALKIPNPIQQTDFVLKTLGKSGAALLPAIRAGFLDVADGAAIMSKETVERLDRAKDAWGNFFNQITIWSGEVLGNLTNDLGKMYDLLRGIGPAASGFTKFFGDVKATAGGFLEGGFAGASGAHTGYMAALKQRQEEEKKSGQIAAWLADNNKNLGASNQWLATKSGELTEAQKKAAAAAEAQRKAVQDLTDELSGAKLRGEVDQLNKAVAKLTAEQKKNPEVLDRMLAKIKPLVAAGGLPMLSKEAHDLYLTHVDLHDLLPKVNADLGDILKIGPKITLQYTEWKDTLAGYLSIQKMVAEFSGKLSRNPLDILGSMKGLTPDKLFPPSLFKTFGSSLLKGFEGFAKDLGPTILSALTGGGDVGKSVGGLAGGFLGKSLVDNFGGVLTKNLGKTIGGAIGSVIPGLGTLLGSFGGQLFDKLFSVNKNVTAKSRESFAQSVLGFTNLGALYDDLRRLGSEGEKLANIGLNVIGRKDEAGNRKWMEDVKKFYDDVKRKQQDQIDAEQSARDRLQATIEKYGFTIDELGPKWRAQQLTEQAQGLLEEMTLLVGSEIENDTVIKRMAASFNEYFLTAKRTNAEIPETMRPTLQRMIDLGLLVDENGDKIEDLEGTGVSFSQTMSQGFKGVIDKLDELIRKVTGDLGRALTTVPPVKIDVDDSAIDRAINRPRGFRFFAGSDGSVEVGGAQHGGLFSSPAVRVVAEAGPEIVGSPDVIVNALAEAMARVGVGSGGGGMTIENLTIQVADSGAGRRALARDIIETIRTSGSLQIGMNNALGTA